MNGRARALGTGLLIVMFSTASLGLAPMVGGAASALAPRGIERAVLRRMDVGLIESARALAEKRALAAQRQAEIERIAAETAEFYRPKTGVNWDGIARCETAGNWSMRGRSFSGGLGFYNRTWDGFGGRQFATNAGLATREQQIVVAERVYARHRLTGWGCRAYG